MELRPRFDGMLYYQQPIVKRCHDLRKEYKPGYEKTTTPLSLTLKQHHLLRLGSPPPLIPRRRFARSLSGTRVAAAGCRPARHGAGRQDPTLPFSAPTVLALSQRQNSQ